MTHRSLALAACLLASSAAQAVSTTAQITAQSALTGLQIAAQQRATKGLLPQAQNACIQALQPEELHAATEQAVTSALSAAEVAQADAFFQSMAGRKYAMHGLLGIYTTLGEQPPEPLPLLTDTDNQAIAAFIASPTGQALLKRQVLQAPKARQLYDDRMQALVTRCRAATPDRPD